MGLWEATGGILASHNFRLFPLVCVTAGDGGNDVSMIQESDCGVGVEGKVSGCRVAVPGGSAGWRVVGWSFSLLRGTASVLLGIAH